MLFFYVIFTTNTKIEMVGCLALMEVTFALSEYNVQQELPLPIITKPFAPKN